jgi:hypothetical protein
MENAQILGLYTKLAQSPEIWVFSIHLAVLESCLLRGQGFEARGAALQLRLMTAQTPQTRTGWAKV